jgi:prepilin-type N-terminal cleavage/methylation domain-containing protein
MQNPASKKYKNTHGFTLIEVLVSLALVLINTAPKRSDDRGVDLLTIIVSSSFKIYVHNPSYAKITNSCQNCIYYCTTLDDRDESLSTSRSASFNSGEGYDAYRSSNFIDLRCASYFRHSPY